MDDRLLAYQRRLRMAGWRVTPQRMLVLKILSQADGHLDATDIYEQGRLQDARLSLSTVYRTLAVFKEVGLVCKLHLDDEHLHYELAGEDEHSHLVCLECGQVIEVDSQTFIEVASQAAKIHGFEIANAQVELTGYCAGCRQRAPS